MGDIQGRHLSRFFSDKVVVNNTSELLLSFTKDTDNETPNRSYIGWPTIFAYST
jgi:hypothetical protein